jgi:Yip1-like protein
MSGTWLAARIQSEATGRMIDQPTYGTTLIERLIAALRLDLPLYQQVSADGRATRQAVTVVLLAGMSNGLGLARRLGRVGPWAGVGAALAGWFLFTWVIFVIATLLRHRGNGRSLLRALGFANAPGVFLILGIVPALGAVVRSVVVLWLLATTVVAVQAVYDVPRRRAWVISIAGFAVYLVLGAVTAYWIG